MSHGTRMNESRHTYIDAISYVIWYYNSIPLSRIHPATSVALRCSCVRELQCVAEQILRLDTFVTHPTGNILGAALHQLHDKHRRTHTSTHTHTHIHTTLRYFWHTTSTILGNVLCQCHHKYTQTLSLTHTHAHTCTRTHTLTHTHTHTHTRH